MQDVYFIPVNSPSAKDTKDGSACESPYSQSVFTLSLCSLWNTRLLTELRLFDSIFLINLQGNKEVLHLSGVTVKICLPPKTQIVLKRALYKGSHDLNNRTLEELEEDADCNWIVCK